MRGNSNAYVYSVVEGLVPTCKWENFEKSGKSDSYVYTRIYSGVYIISVHVLSELHVFMSKIWWHFIKIIPTKVFS